MDSQHRHELEQNDLQAALADFKGFWARWGTIIMLIIAIVAVTLMLINLTRTWRINAVEGAWGDLAGATSPDVLEAVASDHSDPAVQAIARLEAADQLRNQAAQGGDESAVQQQRERAERLYQQVLNDAEHLIYRLNAAEGLATLAEARQQWDLARERYTQLAELAGDEFPAWKKLAEARIGYLPMLQEPVAFAPEPAPSADATNSPQTPGNNTSNPGLLEATDLQSLMGGTLGTLDIAPTTSAPAQATTPEAPAEQPAPAPGSEPAETPASAPAQP